MRVRMVGRTIPMKVRVVGRPLTMRVVGTLSVTRWGWRVRVAGRRTEQYRRRSGRQGRSRRRSSRGYVWGSVVEEEGLQDGEGGLGGDVVHNVVEHRGHQLTQHVLLCQVQQAQGSRNRPKIEF